MRLKPVKPDTYKSPGHQPTVIHQSDNIFLSVKWPLGKCSLISADCHVMNEQDFNFSNCQNVWSNKSYRSIIFMFDIIWVCLFFFKIFLNMVTVKEYVLWLYYKIS